MGKHSEGKPSLKEHSDIENISPENSSSCMGTLKVDINLEKYKKHLGVEKSDEKIQELPQIVQIEINSKEEKWCDDKEEPEQVLTSTFLEENEEESILKSERISGLSNSNPQLSDPLKEAEAKSETCVEKNSNDIPEHSEVIVQEVESDSQTRQVECKLQLPMDVDALSEIKVDEKEEHSCEEPSSTSNTL